MLSAKNVNHKGKSDYLRYDVLATNWVKSNRIYIWAELYFQCSSSGITI